MEIKIPLGQISMETNYADKRTSYIEFLSSVNTHRKKLKICTQCIEIRSDSIKVDNFIA